MILAFLECPRERFENSRNLCDLKHRVFLPQAGLTTDGRRTFIVNTQEYQQYVQVDT